MSKLAILIVAAMGIMMLFGCGTKERSEIDNNMGEIIRGSNDTIIMCGHYYEAEEEVSGVFLYDLTTKKRTLLSKTNIYGFTNMGNRILVGTIETDDFYGIGILNLNTDEVEKIYSYERLDKDLPATYNKQMYGFIQSNKEMSKFYFPYSKYLAVYDAETDEVTILASHDAVGEECFLDKKRQEIYYSYQGVKTYHIETQTIEKVLDAVSMSTVVSDDGSIYYVDRWKGMICKYINGNTEDITRLNIKHAQLDLSKDESKILYTTARDHITGTYTPIVMQYDLKNGKKKEIYRPALNEWVQQAVWDD